jgi:chromosome segregation ATPase
MQSYMGAKREKEGLRGDAIRWLNTNFEGKSFDQRYDDARGLLQIASNTRSVLERKLPSISPERPDVKRTYSQYKSAISQLISDLENSIAQMEKLKPAFSKSENRGQLSAYEAQLSTMKERLVELKQDAKWCPQELRGYKPEMVNLRDSEGKINVQVASLDSRAKSVPMKVAKRGEEMVFTSAEAEEFSKKHMPLPEVKPSKKAETEMVFTLKEVEHGQEIAIAKSEIKDLEAKIKKSRDEGKPLTKLRMQRLDAYLQLNKLTGEPVPERVKLKRA